VQRDFELGFVRAASRSQAADQGGLVDAQVGVVVAEARLAERARGVEVASNVSQKS